MKISFDINLAEKAAMGKTYFFGIGINQYHTYPPLHNSCRDALDLEHILCSKYQFEDERCQLLLDYEATRENIIENLLSYRKRLEEDDKLLIFYSGHGLLDKSLAYWMPVEASHNKLSTGISNVEIINILNSIKIKHTLLIVDSCFAGTIATSVKCCINHVVQGFPP